MGTQPNSQSLEREEIVQHYASGYEAQRLNTQSGKLDRERSRELLNRFLSPAPATILDVGGGPGGHACWLAGRGYQVHLVDITPLHVEMALEASRRQSDAPLGSVAVGDACSLSWSTESVDAVLLLGPLYHLTHRDDRLLALREAYRVLKPEGILLAAGISRFASTLDGLRRGLLKDPRFADIAEQDLNDGQHRNPTDNPDYFMSTFFHHPDELREEVAEAGFLVNGVYGVEGPGWMVDPFDEWWNDPTLQQRLLRIARALETEPSTLGISAHLMVSATKHAATGTS